MRHLTAYLALAAALLLLMPGPRDAAAQDGSLRIVAVVNDEVVSVRDVVERMRMTLLTTGIPDTPEVRRQLRDQALRVLIDERLYMQEAKKRNLYASQEEIDRTIEAVERQMNIPPGRFDQAVQRMGLDPKAFVENIRANLTWNRLVRARFFSTSNVTDAEVDEAVAKLQARAGQTEELVSEIMIPVDSPDQEATAKQTATQVVEQLRNKTSFAALALQFSRGATAANGGDIGWVQRGTLPDELEAALAGLERNSVSDPIRSVGGYYILGLRDRRRIAEVSAQDIKVTLSQIMLGLAANAQASDLENTLALARTVRETIGKCDDVESLAKELKAQGSGSLGTVRLVDLPENFRNAVKDLQVDQTSQPVATPRAVHIFTVCGREEPKSGVDRNQVRNSLVQQRISLMGQRYLQDLRRDATIEFR
jgi:peptidyl-prolyl cis-trans isomerase SurA